ncbi:MAG: LytTR family DNA-binding domain-containing protein [Crocinitomicaceae bacterium]|nr:LytTR family DNA-binding domain-containing protein [Crocinitomicaceae bacterium]
MFRILKSPSTIQLSKQSRWFISIGISVFVFGFLAIFRPFELYEKSRLDPILASACFGLITLVFVSLMLFVSAKYFSDRLEDRWTIGHQLLAAFIAATLIGLTNHLIMQFIVHPEIYSSHSSLMSLLENLGMTYAVGLFPITVFFVISAGLSNYGEIKISVNRENQEEEPASTPKSITVNGTSKEQAMVLRSDSFLFAKAAGNYVEFFSENDGVTQKDLHRITLAKLETIFNNEEFPALKTHRGYIINTSKVLSYQGNSQGYLINFGDDLEKVPVSRKQISDFERVMNG